MPTRRTIVPVISDSRADVSSPFLQPFLAKGIGQGRTLRVNLESSYDWENSQWTVPANFAYSKVTRVGDQLVSWAELGTSCWR